MRTTQATQKLKNSLALALLPAALLLVVLASMLWEMHAFAAASKWEERAEATISVRRELLDALAAQTSGVSSYLLTGDVASRRQIERARVKSAALLGQLQRSGDAASFTNASLRQLERSYAQWSHDTDPLVTRGPPPSVAARVQLWHRAYAHMRKIIVGLRQLATGAEQVRDRFIARAHLLAKFALAMVMLAASFGFLLVFLDFRHRSLLAEARAQEERGRTQLAEEREQMVLLESDKGRAEESNRLKSEFVANMSHELRTPLTAILGFNELLLDGMTGPLSEPQRRHLTSMARSGRHLLNLISDVLDLAKIESGNFRLSVERLSPSALTREVIDVIAPLAAKKNVRVELRVTDPPSTAWLDAARYEQILYNLFSNAVKFTPYGGCVEVSLTSDGARGMRLSVKDSGVGIAQHDQKRLFVPFSQLDSRPAKVFPGTGLGLALCKRFVEAHGGSMEVVSERGRGSVFSALFPDCAASDQLALSAPGGAPAPETVATGARS